MSLFRQIISNLDEIADYKKKRDFSQAQADILKAKNNLENQKELGRLERDNKEYLMNKEFGFKREMADFDQQFKREQNKFDRQQKDRLFGFENDKFNKTYELDKERLNFDKYKYDDTKASNEEKLKQELIKQMLDFESKRKGEKDKGYYEILKEIYKNKTQANPTADMNEIDADLKKRIYGGTGDEKPLPEEVQASEAYRKYLNNPDDYANIYSSLPSNVAKIFDAMIEFNK
jgi:hypothetical protein